MLITHRFEADMPRYYALMTQPKKEWAVDARLREQGYETFFPYFTAIVRIGAHKRGTRAVKRAVFASYIFVRVREDQPLSTLEFTPGANKLVRMGQEPVEIPEFVIDALKDRFRAGLLMPAQAPEPEYKEGETYRLGEEAGPWEGLVAIIRRSVDGNRQISVWLDCFGGKVAAQVSPAMLDERVA